MAGDQKDYDLVKKFLDAYENMDPQGMVDLSADTVKFHPADIAGVFDVDMTNTDFIVESLKPSVESINISEIETVKAGNLLHLKTMISAKLKTESNLKQLILVELLIKYSPKRVNYIIFCALSCTPFCAPLFILTIFDSWDLGFI